MSGGTVRATGGGATATYAIHAGKDSNITVTGGTVENSNGSGNAIFKQFDGAVSVSGGSVIASATNSSTAIRVTGGNVCVSGTATVTGYISGVNQDLQLNIPAGKTVIWQADYFTASYIKRFFCKKAWITATVLTLALLVAPSPVRAFCAFFPTCI